MEKSDTQNFPGILYRKFADNQLYSTEVAGVSARWRNPRWWGGGLDTWGQDDLRDGAPRLRRFGCGAGGAGAGGVGVACRACGLPAGVQSGAESQYPTLDANAKWWKTRRHPTLTDAAIQGKPTLLCRSSVQFPGPHLNTRLPSVPPLLLHRTPTPVVDTARAEWPAAGKRGAELQDSTRTSSSGVGGRSPAAAEAAGEGEGDAEGTGRAGDGVAGGSGQAWGRARTTERVGETAGTHDGLKMAKGVAWRENG